MNDNGSIRLKWNESKLHGGYMMMTRCFKRNMVALALSWAMVTGMFMVSAGMCAEVPRTEAPPVIVLPVKKEEPVKKDDHNAAYDKMELLTETLLHVKKNYVDEKTYEQIINGALHGMLQALDSHSDFLELEAFKDIQEETRGKYGGIGIHVGMKDGLLTVISPIEDTPAYKAGMQSGDRIVEIDGEKTMTMKLDGAVKKMRGQKGTPVTLTIRRPDEDELKKITIVRDDIEVPSVKGATIIGEGVGYVRITQFALPTASSLEESLKKLKEQGMNALILDLRNNSGGLLSSAIDVSQKFLQKG
ncbi:MAG: S41 family peptidase, partial [Kiritimatiellae bacterium]|nr:S41 family peptidase [Kiritimatiellia bacterium]